jgi:hypothetical protein
MATQFFNTTGSGVSAHQLYGALGGLGDSPRSAPASDPGWRGGFRASPAASSASRGFRPGKTTKMSDSL